MHKLQEKIYCLLPPARGGQVSPTRPETEETDF
jgi:hypothetical protein